MSRARGRTVCATCGNNWRKNTPSDSGGNVGCDACRTLARQAQSERDRVAAIWAKVKADESPCCDGAKIEDVTGTPWMRCAACRLLVYRYVGMRGSLREGNREIGLELHDRLAKPGAGR